MAQESIIDRLNALSDKTATQSLTLQALRSDLDALTKRLADLEEKRSRRRIEVRGLQSTASGSNQRIDCAADEVVLACYALMVPSGSALCNVSIINSSKTCATSGCRLPAEQRYQLNTFCGKIID
ncbi:MAG: hypothetical protein AAGL24_18250 [Pseudomonadota bacterium]